ncbi:2-keto-myo-inositol dehydratase [Friedmanniella luteola]|uniref:2-keto-myo-inositol dehydratase n=1 Tax=Friedmanniella luteola TaxID=546871 RepID=A0A1H2A7K5_9ACTN|nr:myo-inosose-2 dehydratase [Friedmanniella luteola]SDT41950.1 2-keto-myo-inositol dehydratase [Friedmanniella luteola]
MSSPVSFDRQHIRLGVTPTLWWNDDFPSIDIGVSFEQCVSEMALAGFEGCSVGHKYPTDPAVLRAALTLRGLSVSEPWTSTYFTSADMRATTVQRFRETLEFIKVMGGTDMVVAELGGAVHPLPVAVFANRPLWDDQQWEALCAGLDELGGIANAEGIRMSYHHHMGTGVMTRDETDRLMAGTNPELVHLCLDTGHAVFAGDDPLSLARTYADRVGHVHLKDVRPDVITTVREQGLSFQEAVEAGVFTVPGDGVIDFVPILQTLADSDYRGWLVVEAEQDPAKALPLEYALKARAYLREVLGW